MFFSGTSPQSSSIEAVLASLCSQICRCYGRDAYEMPTEYTELTDLFKNLLKVELTASQTELNLKYFDFVI